jgi:imidazolonepropionase
MIVYKKLNQIATLQAAWGKEGKNLLPGDLSIINDGAVVVNNGVIEWIGESDDLPEEYDSAPTYDLKGHVLTPELVDSHTHLVFGGDRAQEYADRLNGASYEEIAKRGGGILYTMKETNDASIEELYESARHRISLIHGYGVGTIEIKSGYGLNFEREYELSMLIDRLKKEFAGKVQIFNTYLAAHDVPKNFASSSAYMNEVVLPLLEKLKGVVDAVDVFHEKNYFTDEDTKALFTKAKALGIARKMHADELNDNGGATLSVEFGALSADHLLKISDSGIEKMADSNTVGTLLPGTAFFLGKPLAPARKMLDKGIRLAIASDYNPGSCHCDNLLLIASVAAAQLKMNQGEIWAGITLNGAQALGLKDQGAIIPGFKARFSLFRAESLAHVTYHWGKNFSVPVPLADAPA